VRCRQRPGDLTVLTVRTLNPAITESMGKYSEQLPRARKHLQAAKQRTDHFAYKTRHPMPVFEPGDRLGVEKFQLQTGLCCELAPWFAGPFRVTEAVGDSKLAYKLELPKGLCIDSVLHVSAQGK